MKNNIDLVNLLSVVVPAFNEEKMISLTTETIYSILKKENIPHEIIFVDDGSKDDTWTKIETIVSQNDVVRGCSFSRNFGKEAAILAGLSLSKGDCCAVIDCDLQHPPEKLVEMYHLWEQGYEIVEAIKINRGQESPLHSFCAKCFYSILSKVTHIDMKHASDYKLLDRKAVNALLSLKEKHAFFRALSAWVGFKTAKVEFEVQERVYGSSKWSTRSLIKYAVTNVTSFSSAPMQVVTILGIIMLLASVIMGTVSLVQKICGYALGGFTTVILLQLFIGSIIMISLGIIGYYLSKIYEEIKGRPRYIISKECGVSK